MFYVFYAFFAVNLSGFVCRSSDPLIRAEAKGLLKEPDRLGHIFVLDVLKDFFETLDQPRRIDSAVAARRDPAHLTQL